MEKVKWGILSTARIATKTSIPAIIRTKNSIIKAIASGSDIEKAKSIEKRFDIEKTYDSYDTLLDDPEINAVYIPLPNHMHKEWTIKAANKGKHVLCEKPAALNMEEALEMKQACDENNVLFMEAFMYQFHPQHEYVKNVVESGEIGEVKYIQGAFTFYLDKEVRGQNIRMSSEKGGGSLYDVGSYPIHAIRNLLQVEPLSVHTFSKIDHTYQVDTDATVHLTFPNGVRAIIDSSFNLARRNEYRIYGSKGSITVPRAFRPDNHGGEGIVIIEKNGSYRMETLHGDQYANQFDHFANAILTNDAYIKQTFTNTINNMRVLDACYESMSTGKEVKL